nr:winged helix-turn-helix transcriptional regulator [Chloroflexota bacterium]
MTRALYERQARFFSALAHPIRLSILDILSRGEACVCHLSAILQLRQAYISQQLATLKEAGLITDRKEGLYVYYSLADASVPHLLQEARHCLAQISGDHILRCFTPPKYDESTCTCPACRAKRSPL